MASRLQAIITEWEAQHLASDQRQGNLFGDLSELKDRIQSARFTPDASDVEFLASISPAQYTSWLPPDCQKEMATPAYTLMRESIVYMLVGKRIKTDTPELTDMTKKLWYIFHNNLQRYPAFEKAFAFSPERPQPDIWLDPHQAVRNRFSKIENDRDPLHYHRIDISNDAREQYASTFEDYLDTIKIDGRKISVPQKNMIVNAMVNAYLEMREFVKQLPPSRISLQFGMKGLDEDPLFSPYGLPLATLNRLVHKDSQPTPT